MTDLGRVSYPSPMNPSCFEALIQRALQHHRNRNYQRACCIYAGLLRRGYRSARVLANLGASLYEQGSISRGVQYFQQALEVDPDHFDAWNNLFVHFTRQAGWDQFQAIIDQVIGIYPDNKQAKFFKAQALILAGSFSEAQSICEDLLRLEPDDLELRKLLVRCNLACADYDAAVPNLLYMLSLKPGDAFASIELSEIAAKTGDQQSSLDILLSAYEINPGDVHIICQIAREYQARGRLHEAISKYELALSIEKDSPPIMANLACCYSETGDVSKFFQIYEDIKRRDAITPEMLVVAVFLCSTRGEEYLDKLRDYSLAFWDFFTPQKSAKAMPATASSQQVQSSRAQPIARAARKRKVGVVTGGLGTHVESCFLASFLLNYSKDLLEVEVVSNRWLNDGVAAVLSQAVDACHSISDLPVEAARELILRQDYDLILETTGFTTGFAMHALAARCAPVQCHWIGYHASTYMPSMDYFIGDAILTPAEHADRFTEQIVRLNRAWLAATPFTAIPEARAPIDQDVILGSFSQIAKLTPKTLDLWLQLLREAPQCKLMLKDKFTCDPLMVHKIKTFFASGGVDPERISFQSRSVDWFQHMAMYNLIDIALDTTPWSSATTAFDCLSMGVPLIGIKGGTTAGLMSCSVLHHCGKDSWVAVDEDDFVKKNLALIDSVSSLRSTRRDLQAEILRSQLFDGKSLAREMESFILGA